MAQKKLLFILALLAVSLYPFYSSGVNNNEVWAKKLSEQAMHTTWQNLLEISRESKAYDDNCNDESQVHKIVKLQVFVSASMPINLLKTYAREADKYGAVLLFKGLPNGSFKDLSTIVMSIQEKNSNCMIAIDDETFDKYSVIAVPTVVLSAEEDCMLQQTCKVSLDKITGNIGIHAALQKFSNDGDLANQALEILKLCPNQ